MKKWRLIPKISYCNFRKEYPNIGDCFRKWLSIERYWGGRIINLGIKHRVVSLDFRKNWLADMIGKKR